MIMLWLVDVGLACLLLVIGLLTVMYVSGIHEGIQKGTYGRAWDVSRFNPFAGAQTASTAGEISEFADHVPLPSDEEASPEAQLNRINSECFFKVLSVFPGIVAGLVAQAATGHTTAAMVLLPFLAARAKKAEANLAGKTVIGLVLQDFKQWERFPSFPYLASIPDCVAEYQHGVVFVQTLWLSTVANANIHAGWCQTRSVMCAVMGAVHISGFYALTMCISLNAQLGAVVLPANTSAKMLLNSKIAGFGAISKSIVQTGLPESEQKDVTWSFMVPMCFLGTLPYLQWQTSMAMAEGRHDPTLAVSMLLTVVMAIRQNTSALAALPDRRDTSLYILFSIILGASSSVTLLMLTRVVMLNICGGEWGLSTGCVQSP